MHRQVLSIAPPTEGSIVKYGGTTTCLQGSIRNVKVHPGSLDPPVNGTPGKNTSSQSQENFHLTILSQRLHGQAEDRQDSG